MNKHHGTGASNQPSGPAGPVARGAVARLLVGQAYGFITLKTGREIYFHRADLQDQTTFNLLRVGDAVRFELIDDRISGARAIRVARLRSASRRSPQANEQHEE